MKTASILGLLLMVAGLVALLEARQILARNPVAIAVQAAAVVLMIAARVTFGRRSFHAAANPTAGGLVTWGPYRYWRHPIYAAILLFLWAGVLSHGLDPVALGLAALGTVMTAVRIASEERLLRAEFPGDSGYDA